jgi:uncharacterized protein YeaO (DUF488 family)
MLQIKRAYEPAASSDGQRFLVDRLWPRGVKKENLAIKAWLKDAAPSTDLRNWYHHQPDLWDEFRRRYFKELEANPESWQPLLEAAREGNVTLLYSARHAEQNNAVALKEFLAKKLHSSSASKHRNGA